MASIARHHAEWLSLVEVSGPFVSMPVLLRVFPQGLEPHDPERTRLLRLAYEEWDESRNGRHEAAIHTEWVRWVLERVLEFRLTGDGQAGDGERAPYAYTSQARRESPGKGGGRREDAQLNCAGNLAGRGQRQGEAGRAPLAPTEVAATSGERQAGAGATLLQGQAIPPALRVRFGEHGEVLLPDYVLVNPAGRPDAGAARLLVQIYAPGQDLERAVEGSRWKAPPSTRMMELLHATGVRLGLVTNGEQWMLVDAPRGQTTGFASWYAGMWLEEPLTLRAFCSLLGAHRFFGVADDCTLEAMLKESASTQEEVTNQLGDQVRRAVEMLIQTHRPHRQGPRADAAARAWTSGSCTTRR